MTESKLTPASDPPSPLDLNWTDRHFDTAGVSHAWAETVSERARLDAPQGWLVRTIYMQQGGDGNEHIIAVTETFVPDPNDMWYAGK